MYTHYAVGVSAYGHDGTDNGTMSVATRNNEEDAIRFAEYLMTLSDREILADHVQGEFGTDADSWVESIFVDRWFIEPACIQDGDIDDGTVVDGQDQDDRFRPIVWIRQKGVQA